MPVYLLSQPRLLPRRCHKPYIRENGSATLVAEKFEQGERSVRLTANAGTAGIRQGRLYVEAGQTYDGSAWLKPEEGTLAVSWRRCR